MLWVPVCCLWCAWVAGCVGGDACGMECAADAGWFGELLCGGLGWIPGCAARVLTCVVVVGVVVVVVALCGTDDLVMVMYVGVLDAVADDDDECGWIAACGRR